MFGPGWSDPAGVFAYKKPRQAAGVSLLKIVNKLSKQYALCHALSLRFIPQLPSVCVAKAERAGLAFGGLGKGLAPGAGAIAAPVALYVVHLRIVR